MVASVRSVEPGTQANLPGCSFAERSAAELWRGFKTCLKIVFSRNNRAQFITAFPAMKWVENKRGLSPTVKEQMPSRRLSKVWALVLLLLMPISPALADKAKPPLRNSDVVKLVKAALPESTIIMTIQANPTAFDVSPDDLIRLKSNGVPVKVMEAMVQANNKPTPTSVQPIAAPPATPVVTMAGLWGSNQTRVEVDRVFLLDGDMRTEMKFTQPGTRTRFIYSIQTFAVLGGIKARLRTNNRSPEFEMLLPNNVEISSVLALGLLGERSNGSREILIGGGFMTFSQGLPKDRNMQIAYEKIADQSGAPGGYEIYRIKPAASLKPGEYAFMVSKSGAMGAMGPMAGASFSYNFYELGVD